MNASVTDSHYLSGSDRNWWIPRWLDRVLPSIDVEGHAWTPDRAETAPAAEDDRHDTGLARRSFEDADH